ncbi:MAG TPA: retropepsin-like aspartic protease, partial [Bacillus sp. (in: firmicutes)]|nr:retropepsin-like aspartic protease [Bacillus sp. (in: firmicutes)]
RWHQEFDEVRQSPGESVEEYAKRFNKAAKKLGNDITDIGKAGAFTRGLLPAVKQLAVLGDRSTLTNAMESARRAEMSAMGYAKQMIPEESLGTNNTGSNVFREMKKDKTERDIEDSTKQMEKMMMMIQNNGNNNNGYRRKDFSEVRCYNCGKMGHYKSRCPEITGQRNWNNNEQDNRRNDRNYEGRNENNRNYERRNENNRNYEGRNERSLNFLNTSEENGNRQRYESSEEEDNYEDEYEVYSVATRNRPSLREKKEGMARNVQIESKRERELRTNKNRNLTMDIDEESDNEDQEKDKITRQEALRRAQKAREGKFTCRKCENVGHFTVNCPMLSDREKEKMKKARIRNKERKEKTFPLNIGEHIKNSPCGLSVEQAMEIVPGYKREFNRRIKFKKNLENINYMETPEEPRFTSMKGKAEIEDIEIDAIIDTGAAVSAITRGLMEELGYSIDKSSDIIVVTADGSKSRSLGKIINMELLLGGIEIVVTVQVIEAAHRVLILGNDWLQKVKANIDMEKGKINIKGKKGYIDIPIEFTLLDYGRTDNGKGYEDSDEEYEEEDLREARF